MLASVDFLFASWWRAIKWWNCITILQQCNFGLIATSRYDAFVRFHNIFSKTHWVLEKSAVFKKSADFKKVQFFIKLSFSVDSSAGTCCPADYLVSINQTIRFWISRYCLSRCAITWPIKFIISWNTKDIWQKSAVFPVEICKSGKYSKFNNIKLQTRGVSWELGAITCSTTLRIGEWCP